MGLIFCLDPRGDYRICCDVYVQHTSVYVLMTPVGLEVSPELGAVEKPKPPSGSLLRLSSGELHFTVIAICSSAQISRPLSFIEEWVKTRRNAFISSHIWNCTWLDHLCAHRREEEITQSRGNPPVRSTHFGF